MSDPGLKANIHGGGGSNFTAADALMYMHDSLDDAAEQLGKLGDESNLVLALWNIGHGISKQDNRIENDLVSGLYAIAAALDKIAENMP